MTILPGSPVMNAAGKLSTLGPLVYSEGSWYGFVPTHKFVGERKVREAGTGLVIAEIMSRTPIEPRNPLDGYLNITDAFQLIRFLSYAPMAVDKMPRGQCVDPIHYFGKLVSKRDGVISSIRCTVESVDGPFIMETGHGIQKFLGAFGVIPGQGYSAADFAREGDAGASILTKDHDVLGLLLGVADNIHYCVPAIELMARYFRGFESLEIAV